MVVVVGEAVGGVFDDDSPNLPDKVPSATVPNILTNVGQGLVTGTH